MTNQFGLALRGQAFPLLIIGGVADMLTTFYALFSSQCVEVCMEANPLGAVVVLVAKVATFLGMYLLIYVWKVDKAQYVAWVLGVYYLVVAVSNVVVVG